jgi:hypothetical protein
MWFGIFLQELSETEIFQANVLGWCIEWVSDPPLHPPGAARSALC